jgi:CO/xanthine dehydrogenase Mo-binding subunit
LELGADDQPVATVHCAAAEVGQGFVTLAQQITRTELCVDQVVLRPADTDVGSAGSTSASRQTWMSGGAVAEAAIAVRDALLHRVAAEQELDMDGSRRQLLRLEDGYIVHVDDPAVRISLVEALASGPVDETREYHHARTVPLNEHGQGDAHVAFAFAAHRAVVDVDPDLGLVRVVHIATGQDVGRALNPLQVTGQIEGGIAQGLGLAVMEEIVVSDGHILNPSFTDYLIPTTLDMPPVAATLIEQPEPGAPFGAKGVGEPPTISSTPAIVAAIRAATGLELPRIPVRPQDIALP